MCRFVRLLSSSRGVHLTAEKIPTNKLISKSMKICFNIKEYMRMWCNNFSEDFSFHFSFSFCTSNWIKKNSPSCSGERKAFNFFLRRLVVWVCVSVFIVRKKWNFLFFVIMEWVNVWSECEKIRREIFSYDDIGVSNTIKDTQNSEFLIKFSSLNYSEEWAKWNSRKTVLILERTDLTFDTNTFSLSFNEFSHGLRRKRISQCIKNFFPRLTSRSSEEDRRSLEKSDVF